MIREDIKMLEKWSGLYKSFKCLRVLNFHASVVKVDDTFNVNFISQTIIYEDH